MSTGEGYLTRNSEYHGCFLENKRTEFKIDSEQGDKHNEKCGQNYGCKKSGQEESLINDVGKNRCFSMNEVESLF